MRSINKNFICLQRCLALSFQEVFILDEENSFISKTKGKKDGGKESRRKGEKKNNRMHGRDQKTEKSHTNFGSVKHIA